MVEVGDAPEVGAVGGDMTAQKYVEGRLAQYQEWYDVKATRMKAMHLRMRTVSVVGGALVPVFVNLDAAFARVAATVLSVVVVAAVSLESVYRYREQWKNYRSTEQLLGHERVYFETRVGPYRELSRREAFTVLVARVEKAIANENAATLNVMTLGGQVGADVQPSVQPRSGAGAGAGAGAGVGSGVGVGVGVGAGSGAGEVAVARVG